MSGVMGHTGLPKQGHELLFERPLAMMLLLVANVGFHRLHERRTDAKGTVPFLPFKAQTLLAYPARRVSFQLLNGFRYRHGCRCRDQQMYMVGRAADATVMPRFFAVPVR